MRFIDVEQKSDEWMALRAGKITGTRLGAAVSSKKNKLAYTLASERIRGVCGESGYVNDEMLYGIENEPIAIDKFIEQTGILVVRGGVILSDFCANHMASPDAHYEVSDGIYGIVEAKCTMSEEKHIQRFFEGIETEYMSQVINYFCVSPQIREVSFISYCGFAPERDLVIKKAVLSTYATDEEIFDNDIQIIDAKLVEKYRKLVLDKDAEVNKIVDEYLPESFRF